MKKKGFTLTELLGVIIILGVIALIAFPPILEQIRNSRNSLDKATLEIIKSSAKTYLNKNQNEYPIYATNVFCFSLQTLVNSGALSISLLDAETGKKLNLSNVAKVEVNSETDIVTTVVPASECIVVDNTPIANSDISGASIPVLGENMIPVRYNGAYWIKADPRNPSSEYRWYNYSENVKEWANVVLINSLKRSDYKNGPIGMEIKEEDVLVYLVWIPRYQYKLFNVSSVGPMDNPLLVDGIDVKWENISQPGYSKSNGAENGSWLTHPAFTYDSSEVVGFWVGKFETTGTTGLPTVLPNFQSLRGQNVAAQYNSARLLNNVTTYGLTATNDAHMMKNTQWGAIALLSHSRYGKNGEIWQNPSSDYITGCAGDSVSATYTLGCPFSYKTIEGRESSTTGNIYGIYDMAGGAAENVMGYVTGGSLTSSGFSSLPTNASYYDAYATGTTSNNPEAYARRKLGDATSETRNWYHDYQQFPMTTYPWFTRGAILGEDVTNIGIFAFNYHNGAASNQNSFRIVVK